jgi:5'-methylthioadenosine phosphorylase
MQVPSCVLGLIGGSSTLSIDFPEALDLDYVVVEARDLIFETPFGSSPAFKCVYIDDDRGGRRVLTCAMHGWRSGVSRADASRQVFWVLREAGVKTILAEGGVGAINHLLRPRDLLIPHDYMDFSMRKDVHLGDSYLLVMRNALCPDLRQALLKACNQNWQDGRVFDRGIYVNTDGRHFESPAEVQCFKQGGADVVGQSICPELYLAREIGACYAGLYMVVNYAEGIVSPWQHEELANIFYEQSQAVARILCQTMCDLPLERNCGCAALRKETLLSEVYTGE